MIDCVKFELVISSHLLSHIIWVMFINLWQVLLALYPSLHLPFLHWHWVSIFFFPGSYCNHYFLKMLAEIGRGYYDAAFDMGLFIVHCCLKLFFFSFLFFSIIQVNAFGSLLEANSGYIVTLNELLKWEFASQIKSLRWCGDMIALNPFSPTHIADTGLFSCFQYDRTMH